MTTMYIYRKLGDILLKNKKSFLLLGPRQTGKSTFIQEDLKPEFLINLAHEATYLEFARNPRELEERLAASNPKTVFIDEVQRLPSLLNTIQTLLDSKKAPQFFLTGSSARKLRRGNANLLPGRIHTYDLGPLCAAELDYQLNTKQALSTGTLPGIYVDESSEGRIKTLRSYSGSYLREEIQAEALSKDLEGFSRFLFLAAQASGQFLDLTKLSSEAQVARTSAIRYFEILEDTLIVNRCPSFSKIPRKRLVKHPKFYFFDTGVLNALLGNFEASNDRKGFLFEHLFFNQLLSSAKAQDMEIQISTYRTEHGAEVDFIVEFKKETWAIELKASHQVGPSDFRGLQNFSEFYRKSHRQAIAYLGEVKKKSDGVLVYPWQDLLKEMGM